MEHQSFRFQKTSASARQLESSPKMLVNNWDIHWFDEVESTNLIVKECIRNAKGDGPCGFVAVAKSQTGGKGMRGHSWCSPEGGLYFSLLLEPTLQPEKLSEIPLRIATVVMDALQPLSTEPLAIKLPNDIVLLRSADFDPSQARSFDSLRSSQDDVRGEEDCDSFTTYSMNKSSEVNNVAGEPHFNRSATSGRCKVETHEVFTTYSMNKSSEVNNVAGEPHFNRSATSGPFQVEKLVGISTELYMEKLCVGIGINVFHPEEEFQVEGPNRPVYLEDFPKCTLSIDFVLQTVLDALNVKLEI